MNKFVNAKHTCNEMDWVGHGCGKMQVHVFLTGNQLADRTPQRLRPPILKIQQQEHHRSLEYQKSPAL